MSDDAAPKAPEKARKKKAKKKAAPPPGALGAVASYGLAALSGFLYFLAFPGMDLWPLSFIALVPLLLALRKQTPKRAAGLGWMAGFVMTMTGFYWLLNMLEVFSGFPVALCVVFMAILCAYQAGRIALCGWLYGRAAARGWPAPIVFLLAFAASELTYPLLFPWYYGATVHNAVALMQVADLGGPILVGLVLVAANLAVAEVIESRLEKRPLDRRLAGLGAAVPIVAAVYGFLRIGSVDADVEAAEPLTIGIAQGNQPLFGRQQAIPIHQQLTAELKDKGVDLVVWSEAAASKSFVEATYKAEFRRAVTAPLGVPAVVGGVLRIPAVKNPEGGITPGTYFNTALLADEKGAIVGRYDKQFLLAFGEYLPFGETFPVLYDWSPNSGRFTPGTSIEPLVLGEHRISALICYEDILPSFVNRVVAHANPDLLVNLTNDAWFGDTTEPWIHFALAKLRAVEHRRFLVRSTNSGLSGIIDPVGRVVVHGGTFTREGIVGKARWMKASTVYETLGDIPWWIATVVIAAMAFVSRKPR